MEWISDSKDSIASSMSACGRSAAGTNPLDVEAQGPELFAAVFGDVLRAPGRHPDPVDAEVGYHAVQGLAGLVFDHVGERAGGARQGHVEGGYLVGVDVYAVDQAQVDDVDAQLGVDDVAQRLEDVLLLLGEFWCVLGHQ